MAFISSFVSPPPFFIFPIHPFSHMHRYRQPIFGFPPIPRIPFTSVQAFRFLFLLWAPLYKSPISPATCSFAFSSTLPFSFFIFLPPSFTSIYPASPRPTAAHDSLPLVCTGHAKHQKSVPRLSPLSPLRPAGKLGLLQGQKCHHVGNCCWCCRGRPSASPLPPAYNYVFHGHGKGRGERGRVVRGLAERGN